MSFRPLSVFFLLLLGLVTAVLRAAPSESGSLAARKLKELVDRQREVFAVAEKQGDKLDEGAFRTQLQDIAHAYDLFVLENPKFAPGFVAYGQLLWKVDMRKEAAMRLLRANQLDSDIPLVKNLLGNYLAEEGRPMEALNYFLAAVKLAPDEPLYHYVLGKLLHDARDDFLKSGEWKRDALDRARFNAFKRAAELAPDRVEFVYRYAEAFYDVDNPDWDAALKVWASLEEKATTPLERQTMRLQAANVLLKAGKRDHAKLLLDTVTEPELQAQKQKLVAPPAESAKN